MQRYNLQKATEIKFSHLIEKIKIELARNAILESNSIADKVGLSEMSLDDINNEIIDVRNAKNNSCHYCSKKMSEPLIYLINLIYLIKPNHK